MALSEIISTKAALALLNREANKHAIDTVYVKASPKRRRWVVKVHGTGEVIGTYRLREVAVEVGRVIARERKVEHFIRNKRGWWVERNSYGNDPERSPG